MLLCSIYNFLKACHEVCGKKKDRRKQGDTWWWWNEEMKKAMRQKKVAYKHTCTKSIGGNKDSNKNGKIEQKKIMVNSMRKKAEKQQY